MTPNNNNNKLQVGARRPKHKVGTAQGRLTSENSVDPGLTVMLRFTVFTVFNSICTGWWLYSLVKPLLSDYSKFLGFLNSTESYDSLFVLNIRKLLYPQEIAHFSLHW